MRDALRGLMAQRRKPQALTTRQAEVIGLIARGYKTREIARTLGVSERAVTAHVTRLMARYRVPNRSGLIAAVLTAAWSGSPAQPPSLGRPGPQAHLAVVEAGDPERYANAPFLVAVTHGPEHVFTFVNRMWERVMGHQAGEVIGRRVLDVFPESPSSAYAARQRAFRQGRPTTGKAWRFRWRDSDGTPREAELKYIYQPLRNSAGLSEGVLLIATESDPRPASRGRRRSGR
jgi:PAS domain S-box-containing protein